MRDELHPPVEEYLQTIASLAEEGEPVIQARIAKRLDKTPPSVSQMLDRLITDGYVTSSRRVITLTTKGQEVARSVIRKHRLAERLLVDIIGLPWYLVHVEAGRWEHVISDEVEQRLVALLGDPDTCPHGNPIPGTAYSADGQVDQLRLSDVAPGQTVRFARLTETVEVDIETLRYLDDAGFIPGTVASVTAKTPDDTLILDVDGHTVALGPELCRHLYGVVVT